MIQIFVITKGTYSDYRIVGLRSNREQAADEVAQLNVMNGIAFPGDEYRVETFVVDDRSSDINC